MKLILERDVCWSWLRPPLTDQHWPVLLTSCREELGQAHQHCERNNHFQIWKSQLSCQQQPQPDVEEEGVEAQVVFLFGLIEDSGLQVTAIFKVKSDSIHFSNPVNNYQSQLGLWWKFLHFIKQHIQPSKICSCCFHVAFTSISTGSS